MRSSISRLAVAAKKVVTELRIKCNQLPALLLLFSPPWKKYYSTNLFAHSSGFYIEKTIEVIFIIRKGIVLIEKIIIEVIRPNSVVRLTWLVVISHDYCQRDEKSCKVYVKTTTRKRKIFFRGTRKLPTFYLPLGLISPLKKIARWNLLIFFKILSKRTIVHIWVHFFTVFSLYLSLKMNFTLMCCWKSPIFYNKELAAKREKRKCNFLTDRITNLFISCAECL